MSDHSNSRALRIHVYRDTDTVSEWLAALEEWTDDDYDIIAHAGGGTPAEAVAKLREKHPEAGEVEVDGL